MIKAEFSLNIAKMWPTLWSTVLLWLLSIGLLTGCVGEVRNGQTIERTPDDSPTVELTVSAAASLAGAMDEIRPLFESAYPHIRLRFNFGSSGALQQQIVQGAPVDLFLSAAVQPMQELVDAGLIDSAYEPDLLGNELVAVVRKGKDARLAVRNEEDLTRPEWKTIAVGIPDIVPAGTYAREALTNLGLWKLLQPKIVQAQDVRQVLQYVETGNADIGFVYRTDALSSEAVQVAFTVDSAAYPAIRYPLGIVAATQHPQAAATLFDYLRSRSALDIFAKFGFALKVES